MFKIHLLSSDIDTSDIPPRGLKIIYQNHSRRVTIEDYPVKGTEIGTFTSGHQRDKSKYLSLPLKNRVFH